jgi:septal ring factor EnvC (AmiA/AmiB activator)
LPGELKNKGKQKNRLSSLRKVLKKVLASTKKQQAKQSRARDKDRKQQDKKKKHQENNTNVTKELSHHTKTHHLPWILLAISWISFISFFLLS